MLWKVEAARTAAAAVRASGFAVLIAALERAKALGELPADSDILALARFYGAIVQGMSVQAIDGASASALNGLVDIALAARPGRRPTNSRQSAGVALGKQADIASMSVRGQYGWGGRDHDLDRDRFLR